MKIYSDVTKSVGNTPLIQLNQVTDNAGARVLVKQESRNPLASVKDRIGVAMIETAEKEGKLKKGSVIVEPTSGNTGVALAFVAAAKGYKLILTMPDSMSIERRRLLKILGAELILTPGSDGMPGAIAKAEELLRQNHGAFMPQQFKNPANPLIHQLTTGQEIWNDTEGTVDVFVAGVGTGGTITGVGRALRKHKKSVKLIAIEPEESAVLSGKNPGSHKIQGIGAGFIPDVLQKDLLDEVITVSAEDAGQMAHRLAAEEGILGGISSGANVWAAVQLAKRPANAGKTIVTIVCDTGERYLSTWLFEENGVS